MDYSKLLKKKDNSHTPPDAARSAAKRGLEMREEESPSNKGGTAVGIARARDLASGKDIPEDTIKRMHSFFSRHEVDKQAEGFNAGEEGYPSKGRQAWELWGGDAGQAWAKSKVKQMLDKKKK